jgi:hypothetical protein
VDKYIPDPVQDMNEGSGQSDGLRWCVAAIIVAFPVYLALTRKHFLDYAQTPQRRTSPIRKWLTYPTLFVASMVIIGTLIDLIGSALGGELAPRFLLKVLVTILLASIVFAYYLWELRWKEEQPA